MRLDKKKAAEYAFDMTLRSKNRIYIILFAFSCFTFLVAVIALIIACLTAAITPPVDPIRPFAFMQNRALFTYRFTASVAAIMVFSLAAPILSFFILRGFEKTASLEVVFFSGFIISCITESLRLNLPVFGIWNDNSVFLISIGKVVVAGKFLACASLFFAAVFSSSDNLQNAERNLLILFVSACAFAVIYPIDTTKITSTCCVAWGYRRFFAVIRTLIFLITCTCLFVQSYSKGASEGYTKLLGLVLLMAGYFILCNTDCWIELVVAVPLFAVGSYIYLTSAHRYIISG